MKTNIIEKAKRNQLILFAFFELIVGAILLLREIRDFIRLPKTTEMHEIYGGIAELVDLFKYEESTYSLLYLWIMLLFAGCSYWINIKLHWIFNQILLITLFLVAFLTPEYILSFYFSRFIATPFIVIALFIGIEIIMYRKSYLKIIGIKNIMKWLSIFLGFISSIIFFFLAIF